MVRPRTPRTTRARTSRTSPRADTGRSPGAGGPRLTHRVAVLGLVLVVLVISYASSLRAFLEQRQQVEQTRAEIAQAQQEVSGLEQELRRWADDSYVEQQARARLAYVAPGETGYRVITADGESVGAEDEPGAEDRVVASAWYETLWQSSRRAGREP